MKKTLLSLFILSLFTVIFAIGCAYNNVQYRTNPDCTDPNATNTIVETLPGGSKLGFVEFDDQGWFWEPKQKNDVLEMIRHEAGIPDPTNNSSLDEDKMDCDDINTNKDGVIMILFVHGWKNNATFDNTNVGTFRSVLEQLNEVEKSTSVKLGRSPRKLIGIYAGWRGLSETIEPFEEFSFWGRKRAAERVGSYGAMTELMVDLEMLQKASNESRPTNAAQSKLIIVGHSFGADVVYNAISQIMTERFVQTVNGNGGGIFKPLGDQIILLNPAFEAARVYDLKQLASSIHPYSSAQRPVFTILTSEGDWATHYAFPAGQYLGTLFQSYQTNSPKSKISEEEANHHAVGWYSPIITHKLSYDTNVAATLKPPGVNDAVMSIHELRGPSKTPDAVENIAVQRAIWRAGTIETNAFGNCVLTSVNGYEPHNPILVVSVCKTIMKDHDDIANPILINFLQEYIPFCDNDSQQLSSGSK